MNTHKLSQTSILWRAFRKRTSLLEDKAADDVIDHDIRAGVELRGTNLWVLMFAIFIASIGLNVNSTAVIIGAMLISPLMGPILGVGYGVGVLDIALIKRSLNNLGIAVAIALATSTVYFWVSPLTTATSELLARTTPTVWDVLIALFGGFAGVIGMTRKEKSNIVPGVAIATALMPPLCTAGFGLAHGNWSYFGGALFLFAINSVFIAFSAGVVVRGFHVQKTAFVDAMVARKVSRYVTTVVLLTLVPSAYFAYQLVQQEVFRARAKTFVMQEFNGLQSHVAQLDIEPDSRKIEVTLIGEFFTPEKVAEVSARLADQGLTGAQLQLHQVKDSHVDVTLLKTSLMNDLFVQNQKLLEEKDQKIANLQQALAAHVSLLGQYKGLAQEMTLLFPELESVQVSQGVINVGGSEKPVVVVNAIAKQALAAKDLVKLKQWLGVKVGENEVRLVLETPPKAAVSKAGKGRLRGLRVSIQQFKQHAQVFLQT